jgi:hypothetical protein
MEKLTYITINVPYKGAGNVIRQREVEFEVFKDSDRYSIKPVLTEAERRIANLPETLDFDLLEGKAVSAKGAKDGNLHVITDVAQLLQQQNLIP